MDRWENLKINTSSKIESLVCILEIEIILIFNKFQSLQAHLKTTIEESKLKYYSRLLDSKTSPKLYWSISKTFLNNKKIPCIPLLLHNDKFIMDSKEKAKLFNDFFWNFQSISLLLITTANFSRFLLKKRACHFHLLSFRHMTS